MLLKRRALGRVVALAALAVVVGALAACAGDYPQTTFRPVTDFGRTLNDLFANIFWWTMVVLFVVEVVLIYVLVRFRDRPDAEEPRRIYGNNLLELAWTLGPAIIVVIITVPTVQTIFDTYRDPSPEALRVEAIGHQWWWEFSYPELGIRTANQLYLPVGREIDLHLTSADVLHNWWVPRLGGKRYNYPVVPQPEGNPQAESFHRLIFTVDSAGEYSGQCAEYCGLSHAIMRMRVVALEAGEFGSWTESMQGMPAAAAQPQVASAAADAGVAAAAGGAAAGRQAGTPPADSAEQVGPDSGAPPGPPAREPQLAAQAPQPQNPGAPLEGTIERQGYDVFMSRACVACHSIAGTRAIGRIGPDLTRFGARWSVGAGAAPNTAENVAAWIADPQSMKPGAKMPGAQTEGGGLPPTNLTDEEVRAVAAYLVSLK